MFAWAKRTLRGVDALPVGSIATWGVSEAFPAHFPALWAMIPFDLIIAVSLAIWIARRWDDLMAAYRRWRAPGVFSDMRFKSGQTDARKTASFAVVTIQRSLANAIITINLHFKLQTTSGGQWRHIGRAEIGPRQGLNKGDEIIVPLVARPKGVLSPPATYDPSVAGQSGEYKAVVTLTSDKTPVTREYHVWISQGDEALMMPIPFIPREPTIAPWNDGFVRYEVTYD